MSFRSNFLVRLLNGLKNRPSCAGGDSKKNREFSRLASRHLAMETLEERRLLAVTAGIETAISAGNEMIDSGALFSDEGDYKIPKIDYDFQLQEGLLPQMKESKELIYFNEYINDGRFSSLTGAGYSTVIIDTGINSSHQEFTGRIVYQWDFADNDGDATDVDGHGTHVAGIAAGSTYGIAQDANIIVLKVFPDESESASRADVQSALQWVVKNTEKYNIVSVNMSLGSMSAYQERKETSFNDELETLAQKGVAVCIAAGNDYDLFDAWTDDPLGISDPSCDPMCISVGATCDSSYTFSNDYTGESGSCQANDLAYFSQRDPLVLDIAAPGMKITSAGIDSSTASVTYSGTSMATPIITGTVVLAQSVAHEYLGRSLSVEEIRTLLRNTATVCYDEESDDTVTNMEASYYIVNVYALADTIYQMGQAQKADLTIGVESGWNSGLVVATSADAKTSAATLTEADEIYVNFSVFNKSVFDVTQSFKVNISLSGNIATSRTYSFDPLSSMSFANTLGKSWSLGTLLAGNYTLTLTIDSDQKISESDESNNVITLNFEVKSRGEGYDGDIYEPNNTFGAAANLGTILKFQTFSDLSIHPKSDVDYYQFTITEPGTSFGYVKAFFTHAFGDLNMKLYDVSQSLIKESCSSDDNEEISLEGLEAGTYYIYIDGNKSATNTYSLEIFLCGELEGVKLSTNTPTVGMTITASLMPSGASASYEWFRVDAAGVETRIEGAVTSQYVITTADLGYSIKVTATGKGNWIGSVSAQTTSKAGYPLEGMIISTNHPQAGETITATLYPENATAIYHWYRVNALGEQVAVLDSMTNSYTVTLADIGYFIKVTAEGFGYYGGSVSVTTAYEAVGVLTDLRLSTYAPVVGKTIKTQLLPENATAVYSWYRVNALGEPILIEGANGSNYTPTSSDLGYSIRVTAQGTGKYTGTVSAQTSGKTTDSIDDVYFSTNSPYVGQTISVEVVPTGATVNYRWYRVNQNGQAAKIDGIVESSYTVTAEDFGYYIKVIVLGTGNYTGRKEIVTGQTVTDSLQSVTISTKTPAVGDIIETTLAPNGALADYQWYRVDSSGAASAIQDAAGSSYAVTADDLGFFLKVTAAGKDGYTGEVFDVTSSPVTDSLKSVTLSTDAPEVGLTIQTTLLPENATASYEWFRVNADGVETRIEGETGTSYTVTTDDTGYFIKVIVTGTQYFTGSVSSQTNNAATEALISLKLSTNEPTVDGTLTASLSPQYATVSYQWFRVDHEGIETLIEDAYASSYTVTSEDIGYFIKVSAEGTGFFTGTVISKTTLEVTDSLKEIILSTDEPAVGMTIQTSLDPNDATVSYEWFRINALGQTEKIDGAIESSYTVTTDDIGYFIKVTANGTGYYTASVSNQTAQAATDSLKSVTLSTDTPEVGLTIQTMLLPENATASYEWFRVNADGVETRIEGETGTSYTVTTDDTGYFIKVTVTGTRYFTGSVSSQTNNAATEALTSLKLSTNKPTVGKTLTASLSPEYATVSYQWYRVDRLGGKTRIENAVTSSYTVTSQDIGCFIRAFAEGTGFFTGTVFSQTEFEVTDSVKEITLSTNAPTVGMTIQTSLLPEKATVSYEWFRINASGQATKIDGAVESSYTVTTDDIGYFIKVAAKGTGYYTASVSNQTAQAATDSLKSVTLSTDAPEVGLTIHTALLPKNATASYEWFRVNADGIETRIEGETGTSYTITADDTGYFIKVTVTGTRYFTGSVSSQTKNAATEAITSLKLSTNEPTVGKTLTASLSPEYATVSYQWYRVDRLGGKTRIENAVTSSYTVTSQDIGCFIRAFAEGTGFFTGTVFSQTTLKVTDSVKEITLSTNAPTVGMMIQTSLLPEKATVSYEWFRINASGQATKIDGAVESSYTVTTDDIGCFIKVTAKGKWYYTGSASNQTAQAATDSLKGVTLSTDAPMVGMTIQTTLDSEDATASYEWFRIDALGNETQIEGAESSSYTVTVADIGYVIKTAATGIGYYTGTVFAQTANPSKETLKTLTLSENAPHVGMTVTASVFPEDATVTYKWFRVNASGLRERIAGADSYAYTVTTEDIGYFLEASATGTIYYVGTVSAQTEFAAVDSLSKITLSTDTPEVGTLLTTNLLPQKATAAYEWFRVDKGGNEFRIAGANSSSYRAVWEDLGYSLRVVATGTGYYVDTVSTQTALWVTTPLTGVKLSTNTPQVGAAIQAVSLTPSGATAAYQWFRVDAAGQETAILGAVDSSYTVTLADTGYSILVKTSGWGNFTGTVSAQTTSKVRSALSGVTLSRSCPQIGMTVTAALNPSGASASYEWFRVDSKGRETKVSGANTSDYLVTSFDAGYYLKVVAVGKDGYYGSVSAATETAVPEEISELVVTTLSDSVNASDGLLSLREAVSLAKSGDRITFDTRLSGGVIRLSGSELVITEEVTIDASMLQNGITIDAQGENRVFSIKLSASEAVDLIGLTIRGGKTEVDGGGIYLTGGHLTLRNILLTENSASFGSALYNDGGIVFFENSSVVKNTLSNAGTVYNDGTMIWKDCQITQNSSGYAGGIYNTASGILTVRKTSFAGNTVSGSGGGIYNLGEASLEECVFTGNTAGQNLCSGGGIYNAASGSVTAVNISLTQNSAGMGGAASNFGTMTLVNPLIAENTASRYGGGLYNDGTLTIANGTAARNISSVYGGGIYSAGGKIAVYNSIIAQNTAAEDEGDFYLASGEALGFSNLSSFTDWSAFGSKNNRVYDSLLPLFQDAASGDYTLCADSQGIDAGDNAFVTVSIDLAGDQRIAHLAVDLGAYEWDSPRVLTEITLSSPTPSVGMTLTADLLPSGTSASYQWYRVDGQGRETAITGAVSDRYTVTESDTGYFLKVAAEGEGETTGTVSARTAWEVTSALLDVSLSLRDPGVGDIIAASILPSGATAAYQWFRVNRSGEESLIDGAVSSHYRITMADLGCYLKVTVTGAGYYTGTVSAQTAGTVYAEITGLTLSSYTPEVGKTISARLVPDGTTAIYKWFRVDRQGKETLISGAAASDYTVVPADTGCYLKVVVIGTGDYRGTLTAQTSSTVTEAIQRVILSTDSPRVSEVLTARLVPEYAQVAYEWFRVDARGQETAILGASSASYQAVSADAGYFLKVKASGVGDFTGTVSATTNFAVSFDTYTVTTLKDTVNECDRVLSLREAIAAALPGDRIVFDARLAGGTILLNGTELVLTSGVTIDASALTGGITIDAQGASCIFTAKASEAIPAVLAGLTLQGGKASDGGGLVNEGFLTLTNCAVRRNTAEDCGGGIYNTGTLTVVNSEISANRVDYYGGGIYNTGTLTVVNSTAAGNFASFQGGGIYNIGKMDLINSIIACNYRENIGGELTSAAYSFINGDPGFVESPRFDIDGNLLNAETFDLHLQANSWGIDAGDNSAVTTAFDLDQNARIYGSAVDWGAYEYQAPVQERETVSLTVTSAADVIDACDGQTTLREALLHAQNGDTITFDASLSGETITLLSREIYVTAGVTIDASGLKDGLTIQANQEANEKSRVFFVAGGTDETPVRMIGLTISGGKAVCGGGIYNTGVLRLSRCRVKENTALYLAIVLNDCRGGGIYNAGTLTVNDSEIAKNTAQGENASGGGIYNASVMTLTNVTVVGNSALCRGGGIDSYEGKAALYNSIILMNEAPSESDLAALAEDIWAEYNLFSEEKWGEENALYDPLEPLFADISQGDYRLRAHSQALDAGKNDYAVSEWDLDGKTRIDHSVVDLGAYEAHLPEITGVNVEGYGGEEGAVYDDQAHTVTVTGLQEGDILTYSEDKIHWSNAPIVYSQAGDYLLYVRVTRTGYYDWISSASIKINRKALEVTKASVEDKVYDGQQGAAIRLGRLSGVLDGDDVILNANVQFPDASVGRYQLDVTYTLSGQDADNYTAPNGEICFAQITPKKLQITGSQIEEKTYDQKTTAEVICGPLSGVIAGDQVQAVGNAEFPSPEAGTYRLTVTYSLTGESAKNYEAPDSEILSGTIRPAETPEANPLPGAACVSCGGNRVLLAWDTVAGAESYVVTYSDNGRDWVSLETNASSAALSGLTYGALYTCKVRAVPAGELTLCAWDYFDEMTFRVCPMDINSDGKINLKDYRLFSAAFQSEEGDDNYDARCNIDGVGKVNLTDWLYLSQSYARSVDDSSLLYPSPLDSSCKDVCFSVSSVFAD